MMRRDQACKGERSDFPLIMVIMSITFKGIFQVIREYRLSYTNHNVLTSKLSRENALNSIMIRDILLACLDLSIGYYRAGKRLLGSSLGRRMELTIKIS